MIILRGNNTRACGIRFVTVDINSKNENHITEIVVHRVVVVHSGICDSPITNATLVP